MVRPQQSLFYHFLIGCVLLYYKLWVKFPFLFISRKILQILWIMKKRFKYEEKNDLEIFLILYSCLPSTFLPCKKIEYLLLCLHTQRSCIWFYNMFHEYGFIYESNWQLKPLSIWFINNCQGFLLWTLSAHDKSFAFSLIFIVIYEYDYVILKILNIKNIYII